MAAPPPPLFRAPEQLVPLQIHKRRLILNSSFSCGSHWLCICPVLARPAYPVPAAPSCPGSRLLWSWGLGPQRPPSKLRVASVATLTGGRSRAGHMGACTFPHLLDSPTSSVGQADANPSLAALMPGAETLLAEVAAAVLAGAVSALVCWTAQEQWKNSLHP